MDKQKRPNRIRKYHVIAAMKKCNVSYKKWTGSNRPRYHINTLAKRHNAACECKMWTVVTPFGQCYRVLGATLAEAYTRLTIDTRED